MSRLLFLVLVVIAQSVYGQKIVRHYYDENDEVIDSAKSYYVTVGKTRLSEKGLEKLYDTLFSYYSASRKMKGYQIYDQGVKEGTYVLFDQNGTLRSKGSYTKGKLSGEFTIWYPNGKLQELTQYQEESKSPWPSVITYLDSSGTEIVSNNNGSCGCYQQFGKIVTREDGKIVNGLRDGTWSEYVDNRLILKEEYEVGAFRSGFRFDGPELIVYKEFEKQPEYPGGVEALLRFLSGNMVYPKYARRHNIQGKVFVGFVIDKDGTVSNVNIIKGVADIVDREAVRVVSLLEKWTPGIQRGKKVRVRYVLPINFKLQ